MNLNVTARQIECVHAIGILEVDRVLDVRKRSQ